MNFWKKLVYQTGTLRRGRFCKYKKCSTKNKNYFVQAIFYPFKPAISESIFLKGVVKLYTYKLILKTYKIGNRIRGRKTKTIGEFCIRFSCGEKMGEMVKYN